MPISDTNECSHFFRGLSGPTVRVLLYTDDPIRVRDDATENWSLGLMLQHFGAHTPAFASFCFELVSRNSTASAHADRPIDELLQDGDFDEIWFFGVHQGNIVNQTGVFLNGGPQSELTPKEITALTNWMLIGADNDQRGGGVLMAGDHAEQLPEGAVLSGPLPASGLWGIGRALGHGVPRAGKMRHWDWPPRTGPNNQNTIVSTDGNFDRPLFQYDNIPQRLDLIPFDQGQPHPLFLYRDGTFIDVFPDHMHEGAIRVPTREEIFDAREEWPKSIGPTVVARGADRSKEVPVDLVSIYDGDQSGVGRIVSDSSWHHYFNINLHAFVPPGEVGSATHRIGQFFANLTIWLAPLKKRREMAQAMLDWVATPRTPLEEIALANLNTESLFVLGREFGAKAHEVLTTVASPCEIHELIRLLPEAANKVSEVASAARPLTSRELLSSLIKQHYDELKQANSPDTLAALEMMTK